MEEPAASAKAAQYKQDAQATEFLASSMKGRVKAAQGIGRLAFAFGFSSLTLRVAIEHASGFRLNTLRV